MKFNSPSHYWFAEICLFSVVVIMAGCGNHSVTPTPTNTSTDSNVLGGVALTSPTPTPTPLPAPAVGVQIPAPTPAPGVPVTPSTLSCTATVVSTTAPTIPVNQAGAPYAPSSSVGILLTATFSSTLTQVTAATNDLGQGESPVAQTSGLLLSLKVTAPGAHSVRFGIAAGSVSTTCDVSFGVTPVTPAIIELLRWGYVINAIQSDFLITSSPTRNPGSPYQTAGSPFRAYAVPSDLCDVALYGCNDSGHHFVSNRKDCEGHSNEEVLGYICKTQIPNTSPLKRILQDSSHAHLSLAPGVEINTILGTATNGWHYEATHGYAP